MIWGLWIKNGIPGFNRRRGRSTNQMMAYRQFRLLSIQTMSSLI
jgi:hypothetical protein